MDEIINKTKEMLTPSELMELDLIVRDRYAYGAFAGMIFNKSVDAPDESISWLIKKALQVRVVLKGVAI